jgi:diacylglycerol O-acyltransferase
MRELKSSDEAAAGELITELADQVPPAVLAATLRAAFRVPQRTVTTVATNVPGPRQPLYVLGRRMLAIYPYVPIADQLRIGVAVTSYDGRLFFGVTCDRDSVPDVDVLTAAIEDGLAELLKAAVTTEQESR